MPGAMNKANARQHDKNKAYYENQKNVTQKNKERKIAAQKRFQEKKAAEK